MRGALRADARAARGARQCIETIAGRLGPEFTLDKAWVEATEKRAAQARESC